MVHYLHGAISKEKKQLASLFKELIDIEAISMQYLNWITFLSFFCYSNSRHYLGTPTGVKKFEQEKESGKDSGPLRSEVQCSYSSIICRHLGSS
jgi:hypothetical protein